MNIRKFRKQDTKEVALLAMNTFEKYNGSDFFSKDGVEKTLDFFDPSKNTEKELQEKFAKTPIFYVAEENNKIVGMIRGLPNKISSLFVDETQHKKGVGKKLMLQFEKEAKEKKSEYIKVKASLFATSFYQKVGYKKTTGIRNFMGLKVYNMKKVLN
jgi:histone acetyltransferase (RNA polymerase elongator complex component)